MNKNLWLISTGYGLKNHSIHSSLDDAMKCVHNQIVRGRGFYSLHWEASTIDDNGASDGTITLVYWHVPCVRPMTEEEIEKSDVSRKAQNRLKKDPPKVPDWQRAEVQFVFPEGQVEYVSVCRLDRHRQYLNRAGLANDVSGRIQDLNELVDAFLRKTEKKDAICRCDNCEYECLDRELKDSKDLDQRLDPGGEVPAGECPKCGALSYVTKTRE